MRKGAGQGEERQASMLTSQEAPREKNIFFLKEENDP